MERLDFRALQAKNRRATWLLLAASFVLLALVATIVGLVTVGGWFAVVFSIVLSFVLVTLAYYQSPKLALSATGARPADPVEHARLINIVEEMSIASGLPQPRVYVVDDPAPNAFATGRDPQHAAVAATTGLIAKLDREELQGVMAHEMAHVKNLDIRVMTVAVATAGAIALIADIFWRLLFFGGRRGRNNDNGGQAALALVGFVFVVVLAPLGAALIRASISRSREGLADATGVELTRNPQGLRRALEKLDSDVTVVRRTSHATSHLWIEAPDDTEREHKGQFFNGLYNTHPPLPDRINALRQMEGLAPYEGPDPALVAEVAERGAALGAAAAPTSWTSAASALAPGQHVVRPDGPEAEAGTPTAGAPAGWYADPAGGPRLRWWDGELWTEHVHDARR